MSDETSKNKPISTIPDKDVPDSKAPAGAALEAMSSPEVIVDRVKNQVTIVGPDNKSFTFNTKIIEEESGEEDQEPMTPKEFREALEAVDNLGLTWTADVSPFVKAKKPEAEKALVSEEFAALQAKYPHLPFEIYLAASYKLTGNKGVADAAGGEDTLREKAEIANEILIDNAFRSEFFFKHAIKVPYLRDIDWEVVYKLYERGVEEMPGIAYGLLALSLQDPFFTGRSPSAQHITVAVDENLLTKLIGILNEVKAKLESARQKIECLG